MSDFINRAKEQFPGMRFDGEVTPTPEITPPPSDWQQQYLSTMGPSGLFMLSQQEASDAARKASDFSELERQFPGIVPQVTPTEAGAQLAFGAAEELVQAAPTSIAAARAFSATAPFANIPIPGAKLLPFLAAGTAGTVAYLASDPLSDLVGKALPVSSQEAMPYRVAGETMGGVLGGSASVRFLKDIPERVGGRIMNMVYGALRTGGQTARQAPRAFYPSEALSAGVIGTAGGVAEAYDPGDARTRFAAELGAGFLPGSMLLYGLNSAKNTVTTLVQRFKAGRTEERAARELFQTLDTILSQTPQIRTLEEMAANGDKEAAKAATLLRDRWYRNTIRSLSQAPTTGASPTAAQATGDPILAMLENTLIRGDSAYGAQVQRQGQDAIAASKLLISRLKETGDPALLTEAAKLQQVMFDDMIQARIGQAERNVADAVAQVATGKGRTADAQNQSISEFIAGQAGSRVDIGEQLKTNAFEALSDLRRYERALYENAYRQSFDLVPIDIGQFTRELAAGKRVPTPPTGGRLETAVPKTVVPRNTLISVLEELIEKKITTAEDIDKLPTWMQKELDELGVNEFALQLYQKGQNSPERIRTGVMPEEYLSSGRVIDPQTGDVTYLPLGKPVNIADLYKTRTSFLNNARDSAAGTAQTSTTDARMFGRIANSILADFDQVNTDAYDTARVFSRALNDNFKRSYARTLTAAERTGKDAISPEIAVASMVRGSPDIVASRFEDVKDAVGLFSREFSGAPDVLVGDPRFEVRSADLAQASADRVLSVTDATHKILRGILTDPRFVNPTTGEVKINEVNAWAARNPALNEFPELRNDLTNAVEAQNALNTVRDRNSLSAQEVEKAAALTSVLAAGEKPILAVDSALRKNNPNPFRDFSRLVDVARSSDNPELAIGGLKSAVYDWAYQQALGGPNGFNTAVFRDKLFTPISAGKQSVVQMLRSQGLMTREEVANILRFIRPISRAQQAIQNGEALDSLMGVGSPIDEFAVRFAALHFGSGAIPEGPGSLAAASILSKTAQELFNNLPRMNALATVKEVAADPNRMRLMLQRGKTQQEKLNAYREVADMLSSMGAIVPIRLTTPATSLLESEETARTREQVLYPRPLPPAPSTRGNVPGMAPMQGGGAAPAPAPAPGGAPQASTSRLMLQQLFPNDAIMGAAALQTALPS